MIGPSGTVRVMVATKPVDFRKGMEGLAMLVREHIKAEAPEAGLSDREVFNREHELSECLPDAAPRSQRVTSRMCAWMSRNCWTP